MRGTVAKEIRRRVYGSDFSPKHRKYTGERGMQCHADDKRKLYQILKKDHTRRGSKYE